MNPVAEPTTSGGPAVVPQGGWVVFSLCTRNRLYQARCLMESVRRCFPEARRELLLVDGEAASLPDLAEEFAITTGVQLELPRLKVHAFANSPVGLCCLLKPAFALYLLKKHPGAAGFVYADADTFWFSRPDALLHALDTAFLVLTPHRLGPARPDSLRTDLDIADAGVFNAGVFAFKPALETSACLGWWLACMERAGVLDARHAYDQAWLSLAPVYFPGISVCRDKGVNVAYWNLDEREFHPESPAPGHLASSGLCILHLSTFDPSSPGILASIAGSQRVPESAWLLTLLQVYARRLDELGRRNDHSLPYAYGVFEDGKPVLTVHRQYFRQRFLANAGEGDNPFSPAYGLEYRSGLRALYHADHWLKTLHRRLRSLF